MIHPNYRSGGAEIRGLAYREDGKAVAIPAHPPIQDPVFSSTV